jgi:hypothetical protein
MRLNFRHLLAMHASTIGFLLLRPSILVAIAAFAGLSSFTAAILPMLPAGAPRCIFLLAAFCLALLIGAFFCLSRVRPYDLRGSRRFPRR